MTERESLRSPSEGQRIGRYLLESPIGVGAMATVYRAEDTQLSRPVALKVLHPHLASAEAARARFSREARTAASLAHEFVPAVYDCSDEGDEVAFIACELLSGPTLKAFVEAHGALLPEAALAVTLQLSEALAAAHELGIIHRDVKPENALLHEARCVKLTDFGLAHLRFAPSLTMTGQVLGSPAHMSPEHINGSVCTESSDLFSLGTVLYYLLTAKLPFEATTPQELFRKVLTGRYRPVEQIDPRVGSRISRIVDRLLQVKPSDRFGRADELSQALQVELEGAGIEDSEGFVATYLADPRGAREELEQALPARLLAWSQAELGRRQMSGAFALLSRALVYAPEDRDLLRALRRIGRRRLGRRLALGAVACLLTGLLAGAGWAWWTARQQEAAQVRPLRLDVPLPAVPQLSVPPEPKAPPVRNSSASRRPSDRAASRSASSEAGAAVTETPTVEAPAMRRVELRPTPMNVLVSVDGSEPRPFGPKSRVLELPLGSHSVAFSGATGCCEPETRRIDLKAGEAPVVVDVRLAPRDARLYVASDVPASVTVEGLPNSQRALEVIRVPLGDSYQRQLRVRVSAPGYVSRSFEVSARAGALARLDVSLTPVKEAAPREPED